MGRLCLALCAALFVLSQLSACGGAASSAITAPLPERAATSGDALLSSAPHGADLLLEVDLARLRNNKVVGTVLKALGGPGVGDPLTEGDLIAQADSMLVCVYGVGDSAKQLVLVQAVEGRELAGAADIGDGRYAVGEPGLVARAVAVGTGQGESMLADTEMLRLRADIMPAAAKDAVVRAVARLDFDARVSIASRVGMSEVPVSLALWGDVVDDLAIVASVAGESDASHHRLTKAVLKLKQRVAQRPLIRYLGLSRPLSSARVVRSGNAVQVVFVLSPKRLAFVAQRLVQQLQSTQKSTSQ